MNQLLKFNGALLFALDLQSTRKRCAGWTGWTGSLWPLVLIQVIARDGMRTRN